MSPVQMEFHISRQARDRYQFDQQLFALNGNVVLADFHAARLLAHRMNARRDLLRFPEQAVKAGQINAMGLIDEILHHVMALYRQQRNPHVLGQALDWLDEQLGRETVDAALREFVDQFPPLTVYRRQAAPDDYITAESDGVPHRQLVLEELILLWLGNVNPAQAPFLELFDDTRLEKESAYLPIIAALQCFFDQQPTFGPDGEQLLDMLHSPAVHEPHSLSAQLEFIRRRWGILLGGLLYRLLSSTDLIREEEKPVFAGPGPSRVLEFAGLEPEDERFSPDRDWMPRLVLMAKNVYVWLDQLSKQYRRPMTRLDDVPDEEFDTLARRGFSGLWLIGLWERSPASRRIKQMMGNPEAVASAYSLFDYQIAADLGGEEAYRNLRQRAWQRGVRLASDMVPNHMGIDSRWVIEHPDWFVGLDHSPYPAYSFNGPDLSWDSRVGIYLEDHYTDRSDAAVVFKRVDRWTGGERYIYHGNDGTSMPWNDTAQLDYLNPEVREAVIQTILHVARQFSVIRFDAAMTLAKRHYQRLWFPEPGSGGAIPSRAEHALTRTEFDERIPHEFWREVVDRVAAEVPDTLLLAEAFWLMEGYFVRTLGMHRVYNSAFMNMLRDEDNAKYRSVMKNTLEFDPQILKRYVNFMNNPDERTAVDQFGKGDKYFGICVMLATLPGLPMFGHGQVEGLAEKYGMEYRRAYWDERADNDLVERHEREIFPLLRQRALFAEVEHFLLYDLFTPEGQVNEDVFAYSNRAGDQCALVIYHNKYAEARGWIRSAVAFKGEGETGSLIHRSLGEGLALQPTPGAFTVFRDQISGLESIRSNQELCTRGLYVELGAYKAHVMTDFRQVQDDECGRYARLTAYLDGRGVPSIEEALRELLLEPVHEPFQALVNAGLFRRLWDARAAQGALDAALLDEVEQRALGLLHAVRDYASADGDPQAVAQDMRRKLEVVLQLEATALPTGPQREWTNWSTLLSWLMVHSLGQITGRADAAQVSRSWLDGWLLGNLVIAALREWGLDEPAARYALLTAKALTSHQQWFAVTTANEPAIQAIESWLGDEDVQQLLHVNRHQGVLWFNQEALEQFLQWLETTARISLRTDPSQTPATTEQQLIAVLDVLDRLRAASDESGYRIEKLLEVVKA